MKTEIRKIDPECVPKMYFADRDPIPAVGMGTFASDHYPPETVAQAVYDAVCFGYRHLDCASVYGNEKQIGEVLGKLKSREGIDRKELFITGKVWNDSHGPGEVLRSCRKTLQDLQTDYLDLYLIHWPFPNAHDPGCDGDSRSPDARPFIPEEFMQVWLQCEQLKQEGLVRHIGMSNMTVKKMKEVLPQCRLKPEAMEMELHPSFQQEELFNFCRKEKMIPIGFSPLGSPSRPERDRTPEDVVDFDLPEVREIAKAHGVHPAQICLKWAVQRGQIPIPFAVKEPQIKSNLTCILEDPLTGEEMERMKKAERNCRLVKGQVFLWPGAKSWKEIWDEE